MNKHPSINTVIECSGLTKTYNDGLTKVDVLKDIHFSLKQGERVAIVGSSGSGKSTLLHLLGGLDLPTAGEILVAGHALSEASDQARSHMRNRYLGFIYQFHHLLPEFSVLENVCMPLLIRGDKPQDARERAFALLEKVGLMQRYNHKIGELSGGERQRTAIVRALITRPLCVLADEPTGNLDQRTADRVYETMLQLNQELGTSFIIVTHDLRLAARMDYIYTLINGVLVPGTHLL